MKETQLTLKQKERVINISKNSYSNSNNYSKYTVDEILEKVEAYAKSGWYETIDEILDDIEAHI